MKMAEVFSKRIEILWEKEKSLVTSTFSFSHSVFNRLVLQTRKNKGFSGKGLIFAGDKSKDALCVDSLLSPLAVRETISGHIATLVYMCA